MHLCQILYTWLDGGLQGHMCRILTRTEKFSQEIQQMPVLLGSIGEKSDPQIGMDAKICKVCSFTIDECWIMLTECKSVLLEMNYRQSGGHYGSLLLNMAVFPQRRRSCEFSAAGRIRSSVSSLMKRSSSAWSPCQVLLPYSGLQSQYEKGENRLLKHWIEWVIWTTWVGSYIFLWAHLMT